MLIKGIGVNPASMMPAAEQSIPENAEQVQPEENMFGPEYEVMISEEGRNLSRQQAFQEVTGDAGQLDREAGMLLSRLEESRKADAKRWGYCDELEDEIEKHIKVLNAAYGRINAEAFKEAYKNPSLKKKIDQEKETVEQLRQLQEEVQKQKDFQEEEGLRRLRAAQQIAAMQSARHQEEIDENNRDLVTLLKTMEEAEKAEDERENDGLRNDDDKASGAGEPTDDAIGKLADGFMRSSLNREKSVEELSEMNGDSGRGFLWEADAIAQKLLKKSASIKEAIADNSVSNGQIDEMMESFRSEVEARSEEMYILGSFGTQVLRDMRDVKLRRIVDDSQRSIQETRNGVMQAAADAAFGEARVSSLDETSRELADEVEKLIDERNGMDRTPKDEEEHEQKGMQEELL